MAKKLSKNTPKKKFDIGGVGKINNLAPKPPIFTYPSGTYSPVGAPQGTITVTNEWGEPDRSYAPGAYERHIASKTPAEKKRNQFENIKPHDVIQLGLYGIDAALTHNEALRNQENYNRRFRNVMTQKPIYDYNHMYGPDSSGGTQYQNLIMAKHGAEIRKTTSPMFGDVEVEGGEFIQLPDLTTQYVQGATHEKGGVHTNLPNGTRVFSDHLKPLNSKKTYAQLAKKYDTAKWQKILDNPFAADPDRNTAKLMFDRHESILNELFADQQKQNGNSDGTDQAQEQMSQMFQMPQMQQPPQPQMMGKFGLDLKKGEKLSFTDPFEYGGQYLGGTAEFGYGGMYQDGGMFPFNSTFYGKTPGDASNLTIGTISKGKPTFQEGGTVEGEKTKKPDKSNPFDNDTVKHFFDSMVEEYGYGVVVDKATNKLYYGKVNWDPEVGESYDVQSFEVLTGQNKNVDIDYKKSLDELEVNPYYRATPLGFFTLSYSPKHWGPDLYLRLNETYTLPDAEGVRSVVAVHNTYVGPDDMTRAARYNNQNPEDNYASFGCVNCRPPDLKNLIGFLNSQKNKAQFIINSEKPIEYHKEVFEKNKATFRKPGTNLAANLSVSPKALELYNVEQSQSAIKKTVWDELIKDDYIDTDKLEKEIKNPDSPLNTDPKIKQLVTSVVESNAGQGISLPKNAPEGTIAQEAHTKVTQATGIPADAPISRKYFEEVKNITPKGITQSPAPAPVRSLPTSVNIPRPQQVERKAQAKLAAQSDAAILKGVPSNTNPEKLYEDWNWGGNYGVDVTTEPPPTPEELPQIKEELKVALGERGIDTKKNLEKVDKVRGNKRLEELRNQYEPNPKYEYKQESLPQMKERLQEALKLWKADTKENLDIVAKAKTIRDLNAAANAMQQAVISSNPEIAQDYGFKVSPTLSGLKYLRSLEKPTLKELLKDDDLVNAVKNTNIGSWGMIPKEQRERITAALQNNMPEDIRKEYATKNFGDSEFYYRYPRVEKVEFDNKEEYEAYKKGINVAGKYVSDPELGLYIEPVYTGSTEEGVKGAKGTGDGEAKGDGNKRVKTYPGSQFTPTSPMKQMPSTAGDLPMYQVAPELLGYISGLQTYSYYTPDFSHTEVAPPTLNIDTQLQSINDSLQSTLRQSTGNASLDNSRRSALFNQALAAKQQAFAAKQNYDAQARFQADQYNAQARDLENFRDVSSAANVHNEYMAAAQDAAQRERLSAITNLVDKKATHDAEELRKIMYFTTMYPKYYYEGNDRLNPIKFNPYADSKFYSKFDKSTNSADAKSVSATPPEVAVKIEAASQKPVSPANTLNLPPNPNYPWPQPQFGPTFTTPNYTPVDPNSPIIVLPELTPPSYLPPSDKNIPENIYDLDEGRLKYGGKIKKMPKFGKK